jgi:ketose-bisphosphate aldolase
VIAGDRCALLRAWLGTKRPMLATNINDQQDIGAAVEAAQQAGSPIILLASVRTIEHAGLSTIAQLVHAAREQSSVPVWLQLDHASDLSLIERCIEAGFDIVMADFSPEPLEENVRKVREVVRRAHAAGVLVEGEVGALPDDGNAAGPGSLTSPAEAHTFAAATGVDLLAVSVGNRHGFERHKPAIDCARIRAIASATPTPLVLHGGDYCSREAIAGAMRAGMTKANFGPELREAYCVAVRAAVEACDWQAPDHRPILHAARAAVREAILRRFSDVASGDVG